MAGRQRFLTKSLFKKACECPRKLIYASSSLLGHHHAKKESGQFLQSLADEGEKVGEYARLCYQFSAKHSVHIGRKRGSGNQTTGTEDDLVEETRSRLLLNDDDSSTNNNSNNNNGTIVIFEGVIRSGPYLIRTDILEKVSDHELRLMEVKAKSWNSKNGNRDDILLGKRGGIKKEYLPYIQDVAFQKMIVQRAFPDHKVTAWLVMPDKAKINTKIPNLNGLFKVRHSSGAENKSGGNVDKRDRVVLHDKARKEIIQSKESLLTEVNVDALADIVLEGKLSFPGSSDESFSEAVSCWAGVLSSDQESSSIFPPIGNQCSGCEYRVDPQQGEHSGFDACWKEATGLSQTDLKNGVPVVDLWYGGKSTNRYIKEKKYFLSDLSPEDLGLSADGKDKPKKKKAEKEKINKGINRARRQWYQCRDVSEISPNIDGNHLDGSVIIERDYLSEEMNTWSYPLHFLDFETASPALPYTIGKAPFDVIAFQFSHHTLHYNGRLEHNEFLLAEEGNCPNTAFLDALAVSMHDVEGTVFRYAAHENTVLANLLKQGKCSVETSDTIESLLTGGPRAMVDLMQVATRSYFVFGSGASSSIKKLLLPTMQASGRLRHTYNKPCYSGSNFTDMQWWQQDDEGRVRDPYSLLQVKADLDSNTVADGGDAIVAYNMLQSGDLDLATRSQVEASLLRYCELDTLAMVMLVQAWEGFLDDGGGPDNAITTI